MNRISRSAAAGLAAAVALGLTAPAVAAPKHAPGHAASAAHPGKGAGKAAEQADKLADKLAEKSEKVADKASKPTVAAAKDTSRTKGKPTVRHEKVAKLKGKKAQRGLAKLQRRLTKQAVKKERFLTRLVSSKKLTRLPEAQQTSVIAGNISADLSELADLKTAIAAGEDLRGVAVDLRGLRPEVYNVVLNQLRLAEKLRVVLELADQPVAEEPVVDVPTASVTAEDPADDPTDDAADDSTDDAAGDSTDDAAGDSTDDAADAPAPTVDAASLDAVVAQLLTFNARTPRSELRAAQRALSQIKESLEAADDADEADQADDAAEPADEAAEPADDAEEGDTPLAGTPVIGS